MSDATPRLGLPWIMPAQAQKHVTVNESLGRLDALVQAGVESRSVAAQPSDPGDGQAWILPEGATGDDWDGFSAHDIAYHQDGAWRRIAARTGLTAHVADEGALLLFDGAAWTPFADAIAALDNLQSLGVGTAPDGANPFAAKLNAALWTARYAAEGGDGDLRYTMNKEGAANALSLLLQSDYSGRAEIGLTGTDDLTIKVSADGASWLDALTITRADARVGLDRASVDRLAHLNTGPLGGLRNMVMNGDFRLWSRGTSFSGPAATGYQADRWRVGGCDSVLRSADAPAGQGFEFSMEFGSSTPSYVSADHRIEASLLRGRADREATISFWFKNVAGASAQLHVSLRSAGAQDDFSSDDARHFFNLSTQPVGAWIFIELPVTLDPAVEQGMALRILRTNTEPATTRITGVQIEPGGAATPFEHRPAALEEALCRRYFEAKTVRSENGSRHIALAPKRIVPAVTVSAGAPSHVTEDGFELADTAAQDSDIAADAEL